MKNFCAFLLTLVGAASALFGVTGCGSSGSDAEAVIDLRKVSDGKMPIHDLYDTIEVVALEDAPGGLPLSDLTVTEDRFFFKGGDRLILSYRQDGSLADSLNPGKAIVDYSIYQDRILDILFDGEMRAYRLPDLSLSGRSTLDTLATTTRLSRCSENLMFISGYKGLKDYLCLYYFDTKKLYACPGFYNFKQPEQARSFTQRVRYFHVNDKLILLDPASGWLWLCGDFSFGYLWLDFKRKEGDKLTVTYAQATELNAYYALSLNGEELFLAYDRTTKKGRLFKTTREGLSLPLGELRDGINYFCCPAAELPRYLTRDVLTPESASAMDAAMRDGGYALIKYHLKTSAR